MNLRPALLIVPFAGLALAALAQAPADSASAPAQNDSPSATQEEHWPQWRGPLATGEAPTGDPPVRWSESEGVRWKVEIPGRGHSTPIVWGDRIFLTTAVPVGEAGEPRWSGVTGAHDNLPVTHEHRFEVLALDRSDGRTLWRKAVKQAWPFEGAHRSASLASASPATDGERIFAFFGSYGLYALDLEGEVLWQKDMGRLHSKHAHGEGASPVLHDDTLVVNWDHEGPSFLVAFEVATGEERWRVARDEVTSWATPLVVVDQGRPQVIVPGTERVRGYDLATGEVLWECGGLSANVVASPVAADGMVFVGSSYDTRALLALRYAGARGDVTGSDRVVWQRRHGTPYVPSPLLVDGALYFLRHYQGILTRVDAATGVERPGPIRLGPIRNVYASPVAAAGRVYITDLEGTTLVLTAADEPEVLAVNRLDDRFAASAAIAGDDLFLRGERHLYRLGRPQR